VIMLQHLTVLCKISLGTARSEVGGVLIGILGIALLWKGSRVKEIPRHLHTD
jgi:hypothetical protein